MQRGQQFLEHHSQEAQPVTAVPLDAELRSIAQTMQQHGVQPNADVSVSETGKMAQPTVNGVQGHDLIRKFAGPEPERQQEPSKEQELEM